MSTKSITSAGLAAASPPPPSAPPPVHAYSSALDMAAAIRAGVITSRELVELHISRIEQFDLRINAVVLRDFDAARTRADEADAAVAECGGGSEEEEALLIDALGPFHGVPVTLKESIFTPGYRTTMGDPKFWLPSGADCNTARIMIEEGGAVLLGKTNLCSQMLDWECNNPVYGHTSNPYDITRSPGGSSGGGAAALAAGLTPLEVGTDLGGSVRIPAAMCGVVGHCATRGIVPNPNPMYDWPCGAGGCVCVSVNGLFEKMLDGLLWMARAGPLARTVEDVTAMVELLGGERAAGLRRPAAPATSTSSGSGNGLEGARVAVWRTHEICPPGREVSAALDAAVAALKSAGATVEEFEPPLDPVETYLIYLRFLGPITGRHMSERQRVNAKKGRAQDSYPPEMRSPYFEMDLSGVDGVPEGNQAAYEAADTAWDTHLGAYDAVLSPVFPCEAWPMKSEPDAKLPNVKTGARIISIDGEDRCYGDALFWSHLSVLCGLPSTSFPVRFTRKGLPVGLQAFGRKGSDFVILDVVGKLMRELNTDRFTVPRGFC